MEKQIPHSTLERQRRIAIIWDAARRAMLERTYGEWDALAMKEVCHPRSERLNRLLDPLLYPSMLDASIGSGTPTLISPAYPGGRDFYGSDADEAMLGLLKEKYEQPQGPYWPGIAQKYKVRAMWQELPGVFRRQFNAVMILGNSLPYASSWDGKDGTIAERYSVLRQCLSGIKEVVAPGGVFLFDIPVYGRHVDIGWVTLEDRRQRIFMEAITLNGLRYWTLAASSGRGGREIEEYTLAGLPLNVEDLTGLLKEAGFSSVKRVPDDLQLDLPFYEAYAADRW